MRVLCRIAPAALLALILALPCRALPEAGVDKSLSNLILISLDTTRSDHLSLYGYALTTSPNLDRFARDALVFDEARTAVPLTGPSHSSVFTSLYAHQHGAFRNGVPLKADWVTLATVLLDRGYHTSAFVSGWTLAARVSGLDQGFVEYDDEFSRRYKVVNRERMAADTVAAVKARLDRKPLESPFFLFVHFFDAHDPFRRHPGVYEPLEQQALGLGIRPQDPKVLAYDNEIAYADIHLGKLLELCAERGLLDNTVVVIFSDHGESLGEHDYWGHGRRIYEQTLRVPLILHAPHWFQTGRRIRTPVTTLDLLPTALSLLGIAPPPALPMEGRDLTRHLLTGEPLAPRRIYFETFKGTLKRLTRLFVGDFPKHPAYMGYADGSRKVILKPESSSLEVYDLASDPGELQNLAAEMKDAPVSSQLYSWYAKGLNQAPSQKPLSRQEIEQLKSLGYVE